MRFEWRVLVQRLADANVLLPSDLFTKDASSSSRCHVHAINTPDTLSLSRPLVMKRPAAVVKKPAVKQICKALLPFKCSGQVLIGPGELSF